MLRLAALKWLALLGAAIFAFGTGTKVHAAGTYVSSEGINTSYCSAVDNHDQYCNASDVAAYVGSGDAGTSGYATCFYDTGPELALSWTGFANYIAPKAAALGLAGGRWFVYSTSTHASCQAAFDAGTGFTAADTWTLVYHCPNGSRVANPATCPAVPCASAIYASLQLKISGPNPSSNEYVSTCFEGCTFDISSASIFKDVSSVPEQYYMKGSWFSKGTTCATGSDQVQEGEVQDPFGGGEAEGTVSVTSADGCADVNDVACHESKVQQAISDRKIDRLTNAANEYVSTIGKPLQFPAMHFFDDPDELPAERVCKTPVSLPVSLQTWMASDHVDIDFCDYTDRIDSIGGWLLYAFTAMALWGLFMRTPEI